MAIGEAVFSVTEEARAWSSDAPPSLGGSPVVLQLKVESVDAAFETMCAAGATVVFPVVEFCGERMARLRDPRERPEVAGLLSGAYRAKGNFSREVFLSCIHDPDGVFHWNVTERLKDVSQPALVIAGQEDQTMPMEAMHALTARMPHAEFKLVADVGHYYPLERPHDFNEDLRTLLSQIG